MSPTDIEHDYEPVVVYESVDAIAEETSQSEVSPVVVPTDRSNVFGAWFGATSWNGSWGDDETIDATWQPQDVTIDTSTCTSGEVSFIWGVYDLSRSEHSFRASVQYGGPGYPPDGTVPCEGEMTGEAHYEYTEASISGNLVACSVDYDCGYDGVAPVWFYLELTVECEDDPCDQSDDGLGLELLVWLDDIAIDLR